MILLVVLIQREKAIRNLSLSLGEVINDIISANKNCKGLQKVQIETKFKTLKIKSLEAY